MPLLDNLNNENARLQDVGYKTSAGIRAVKVIGEVNLVDELGNQAGTATNPIGVILIDSSGEVITSLGGGGAGSGDNVYSDLSDDFTTLAITGTKTFNVLGISFTPGVANIAASSVKRINAAGVVSDVELSDVGIAATSGGYTVSVTDENDNFIGTDIITAQIPGPDKGYDTDLDADKNLVQNPVYAHYTDPENVVSVVNAVTGTYRVEWEMASYKYMSIQIALTGGVTGTIWATNDSNADTDSDLDWVDTSADILGQSSVVDDKGIYFVDTPTMPLKFMFKYICGDATNAVDVHLIKYA